MRRAPLVLVCTTLLAACGGNDHTLTGPDDPTCVQGEIAASDTATGRLGATSCSFTEPFFGGNDVFYDSYTFRATAGKAYQFTARAPDTATDYAIELWGRGSAAGQEQLLAADNNGGGGLGGRDPQLYFVAPQSGVYSLRVLGHTAVDTGTYVLTGRECPVHATITTELSSDGEMLQSSDCVEGQPNFNFTFPGFSDSSRIALYTVRMDGGTQRRIHVVSHDFEPGFYIAGPGFDAVCSNEELGVTCNAGLSLTAAGADSASVDFFAPVSGEYTLSIGGRAYTATGTFKLIVEAARPD